MDLQLHAPQAFKTQFSRPGLSYTHNEAEPGKETETTVSECCRETCSLLDEAALDFECEYEVQAHETGQRCRT